MHQWLDNCKIYNQTDVAPTIARLLNISYDADGNPINEVIDEFGGEDTDAVVLLIIDSLGFNIFKRYLDNFKYISSMLENKKDRIMIFKLKAVARYTTPCIATLLNGKNIDKHMLFSTDDVYKSSMKSILEVATEKGYITGIVMEKMGALSFKGRLTYIVPIDNRPDIIYFDKETVRGVLNLIPKTDLLVAHLRTIDVIKDYDYATRLMDGFIKDICEEFDKIGKKGLFLLCGDHPVHEDLSEDSVALIVFML
ncbi:MAG: hypothetical protein EF806_05580 [Candidatus Methanoliparum thermophilum]|uniref:Sulfatase N-terminal domain-containing protein n=1 Tax=Methanoliparum thermophilum TaxID=2491083 RepID=A0A520KR83_METT2|nr:MAG: hypothetical protein EF806_05580 [Candidatus Methanoliparum thermophilum]